MAHVLNRGNARATVFRAAGEYADFVGLLGEAKERFPVDVYAFCVMPNHFHVVLRADSSSVVSDLMQWWLTSHVRRHHKRLGSSGHVWQGRYKSFPVQEDAHLLTVLRYVLLNPCRAGLASDAFAWRWSSLRFPRLVSPWPVVPAVDLASWLSAAEAAERVSRVRQSIARSSPYGAPLWQRETARAFGLESTLRPLGRPGRAERTIALPEQCSLASSALRSKSSLSPF